MVCGVGAWPVILDEFVEFVREDSGNAVIAATVFRFFLHVSFVSLLLFACATFIVCQAVC